MTAHIIAAYVTGVVFLSGLLMIACYMAFRRNPAPIPREAMFLFRVILALAGAGFAVVLSGFIEIEGKVLLWQLKAGGSLAVFAIVYLMNPPDLLEKRLPKPARARRVAVPRDRIDENHTQRQGPE
jgi:hypothetical protein